MAAVTGRDTAAGVMPPRPVPGLRECADCGQFQGLPDCPVGHTVRCVRCGGWMRTVRRDPVALSLACTLAALSLYVLAVSMPLMTLDIYGRTHTADILTGPLALLDQPSLLALVGGLVMIATVLMPAVVIGLNLVLFLGVLSGTGSRLVPRLLRFKQSLQPWSMIEVYMLGIFVAYTKLVDLAHVDIGVALYALAAIMVLMIAGDSAFDAAAVWERLDLDHATPDEDEASRMARDTARLIACHGCELVLEAGTPENGQTLSCPRCAAPLERRKPDSLRRTGALLLAAIILYVPANILPVLTLVRVGRGEPSTIIAGVEQLYAAGMLPLALLVFFASITVPCLKVIGLATMITMTALGSDGWLLDRTRLFRVIDFIGRWSMIDVFMISILVAIVHFGFIANVTADPGVIAFASVVVLTIFAANAFDPRLMWDAAERRVARRRDDAAARDEAAAAGRDTASA